MQRYTLKFNFQIKFYFFIENLCFCSLKIAVYAPKITIGRKKIKIPVRLKITVKSKNYRARACVCAYVWQIAIRHTTATGTPPEHTTGTHDHRKREEHQQAGKPAYIGIIAGTEKKVKKNLEM